MKSESQVRRLINQHTGVTAIERAESAAVLAKQFEKAGDYDAAYEVLSEFWPDRGSLPHVGDLDERSAAEIYLRAGAMAGWLGSADQVAGSQEVAKNLITRSLEAFQALGIQEKIAEAWSDLGLCYWREGSYDEARIQFSNGLKILRDEASDLKAVLLIRAGIVEVCARRLNEALRFYNEAGPLVDKSQDHGLKGSYHIEFGLVFRRLAAPENREDYLDKALVEYSAASFHFEQDGNTRALARVETNLGYLFYTIGRYTDAHQHLDRARRLFVELGDEGTAARVDESRARTLAAEGRLVEAERTAKAAVKVLEKGGEQAILADALTTYGMVVARVGHHQRAKVLFERAFDVAETTGDREGAGRTRLSIIEELRDTLPARELVSTYRSAIDLLKGSQDPDTGKRLILCADVLFEMMLSSEAGSSEFREANWEGFSFREHVKKSERAVIERALRDAHGSVTKAASLLGFKSHQNLIGIINTRHPELLRHRSPIRKHLRHLISHSKPESVPSKGKPVPPGRAAIMFIGDQRILGKLVAETVPEEGIHFNSCDTGTGALKLLKGDGVFDLVIVDNELLNGGGLDLVTRIRSLTRRRSVRILMIAQDDCEREAWRAGVNAFLRKEDIAGLPSTIERLLQENEERKG